MRRYNPRDVSAVDRRFASVATNVDSCVSSQPDRRCCKPAFCAPSGWSKLNGSYTEHFFLSFPLETELRSFSLFSLKGESLTVVLTCFGETKWL